MSSAGVWIVEHDNIAGSELDSLQRSAHRHRHRAEMHWHVIALSNQEAVLIEDRARVVPSLFYVWGESRASQAHTHLFGYRGIKGLEDLELDWINFHHLT